MKTPITIELYCEDIIACPFCGKHITLEESRSIYKNTEEGHKRFLGCRECQPKETLPYDHEEYFVWFIPKEKEK